MATQVKSYFLPSAPEDGGADQKRFAVCGSSLGLGTADTPHLMAVIDKGLPFKTLKTLADNSAIPLSDLAALVGIPARTLSRRRNAGHLDTNESQRLLRVATVFEAAVHLFDGNVAAAVRWLTTPSRQLHGTTPLLYSRLDPGAQEVLDLIGRLEHGVFS